MPTSAKFAFRDPGSDERSSVSRPVRNRREDVWWPLTDQAADPALVMPIEIAHSACSFRDTEPGSREVLIRTASTIKQRPSKPADDRFREISTPLQVSPGSAPPRVWRSRAAQFLTRASALPDPTSRSIGDAYSLQTVNATATRPQRRTTARAQTWTAS